MNSLLLLLGTAMAWALAWPVLKFVHEGNTWHLPANPKPIYYLAIVVVTVALVALVAAFFVKSIGIWAIPVAFLIAGPVGGDLGVRLITRNGNFLYLTGR